MFEHHNIFMIQYFVNNMMNILDHASDFTLIININIMISFFHDLVMNSNT